MTPHTAERWRGWLETPGRVGVKVCGVRTERNAMEVVEAGADALGFNLFPGSKRFVELATVAGWIDQLPPHVLRVAVVVEAAADLVQELVCGGLFDAVQFHGRETPEFCRQHGGHRWIKAFPVQDEASLAPVLSFGAPALLLDAHAPGVHGGTGRTIDWSLAARCVDVATVPVILSGGLRPDNIETAVRQVRPAAVDTASGVETSPGVKDPSLVRALVEAVRRGQASAASAG